MNKVILCGRVTKDLEVRYTQVEKSTAIANFSLAVNRRFKREGQPDTDFFNCTAFGKTAETLEKYCKKGTKLIVSGSLQNDSYTDKDGNKKTVTKIMVGEFEFAEGRNASNNSESNNENPAPAPEGFMNAVDASLGIDDLPFA